MNSLTIKDSQVKATLRAVRRLVCRNCKSYKHSKNAHTDYQEFEDSNVKCPGIFTACGYIVGCKTASDAYRGKIMKVYSCKSTYFGNKALFKWFSENDLLLKIKPFENAVEGTIWHSMLVHKVTGSTANVKDYPVLVGVVGSGNSIQDAFDDMVKKYLGQTLRFEHWVDGKYEPIDIKFPVLKEDN